MQELNFPKYDFKIIQKDDSDWIFDEVRAKFIKLNPEEWVRQNLIKFLSMEFSYPISLMSVEKGHKLNSKQQRSDLVLYNNKATARMLIECKAPNVAISQDTFNQAARYNLKYKAEYLLVSNGLKHYCCKIDIENNKFEFLKKIPNYKEL
jgi:hypothetical protein